MIPRCFVSSPLWNADVVHLDAGDSHHLGDVLRCGPGDPVILCDGQGGEATCRIECRAGASLVVAVLSRTRQLQRQVLTTLVQAIPKSQRMEWIIQKATEIGVCAIVPIMTERGVVRLEGDRARQRVTRWRKIAEEAARQSRAAWIPRIDGITGLLEFCHQGNLRELALIGSLESSAVPLRQCLRAWTAHPPRSVTLFIGPEGDFSPTELEAAKTAGAVAVSYGPRVLRVETAALYGLSAIAYEFSDGLQGGGVPPAIP